MDIYKCNRTYAPPYTVYLYIWVSIKKVNEFKKTLLYSTLSKVFVPH